MLISYGREAIENDGMSMEDAVNDVLEMFEVSTNFIKIVQFDLC